WLVAQQVLEWSLPDQPPVVLRDRRCEKNPVSMPVSPDEPVGRAALYVAEKLQHFAHLFLRVFHGSISSKTAGGTAPAAPMMEAVREPANLRNLLELKQS